MFGRLGPEKVAASYSPLAHGMDRNIVWQCVLAGGKIGNTPDLSHVKFHKDLLGTTTKNCWKTLKFSNLAFFQRNCNTVQYFTLFSMPHFWNNLYSDFQARISQLSDSRLAKALLEVQPDINSSSFMNLPQWSDIRKTLTEAAKAKLTTADIDIHNSVLREMSNKLGGKLIVIGTGGASTNSQILQFLKQCFSCDVIDTYGTTGVDCCSSILIHLMQKCQEYLQMALLMMAFKLSLKMCLKCVILLPINQTLEEKFLLELLLWQRAIGEIQALQHLLMAGFTLVVKTFIFKANERRHRHVGRMWLITHN